MYDIEYRTKKLYSITSFTSEQKILEYVRLMKDNHCWVLSEAWTPWLSDPWKELVRQCREHWVDFTFLPWANALIPCVVASPWDTSKFSFLWFVPRKKWRQTFLQQALQSALPVYMYESVHRLEKLLKELVTLDCNKTVFIWKELTKLYEWYIQWSAQDLLDKIDTQWLVVKWEFVIWLN